MDEPLEPVEADFSMGCDDAELEFCGGGVGSDILGSTAETVVPFTAGAAACFPAVLVAEDSLEAEVDDVVLGWLSRLVAF